MDKVQKYNSFNSQRVFIVVSVYFVIDLVRKLLDTPSYTQITWPPLAKSGSRTSWTNQHKWRYYPIPRWYVHL